MAEQIIDSHSEAYNTYGAVLGGGTVLGMGQTFACETTADITTVKFFMQHGTANCTGNMYAKLYAHTGTWGSTGVPTGAVLATSDAYDVTTLDGSWVLRTFTFTGAEQYTMESGTKYCITCEYDSGDVDKFIYYGCDTSTLTHAGNSLYYISSWNAYTPRDSSFYVYGEPSAPATSPGITIAGRKIRLRTDTGGTTTTAIEIDSSQNSTFSGDVAITGETTLSDKLIFTQTDGNEYIDSLTDGELDLEATTSVNVRINGTEQVQVLDGILQPTTDSDVDLGTSSLYFKDAYIDKIYTNGNSIYSDTADEFSLVGSNGATADVKLLFESGNEGSITWMEDEKRFDLDGNSTNSCLRLLSTDGANDWADLYVNADSDLLLMPNSRTVCLGDGTAGDSTFRFYGATSLFTLVHDDSEGTLQLSANDATNYTQFASDGIQTMAGTARVKKGSWMAADALRAGGTSPATFTIIGLSGAWRFADAQEDEIIATFKVPEDMDRSVAPEFIIGWSTNDTNENNVEWKLEYLYTAVGEDTSAAAQDTDTDTDTACAQADGLNIHSKTLDVVGASDVCIHLMLTRLAKAGSNDTIADNVDLHGICFQYTSNKLGVAL